MRILFCGQSQYPNNSNATSNRYASIAKTMAMDNEVIFVNRIPHFEKGANFKKGEFKVVDASGLTYRPDSFLKRNFIKFFSPIYELKTFYVLNKEKKIDWVNIYSQYFGICFFYYILSKIFNFRTIFHYVELRSIFKKRSLFFKINDYLFDNYSMFLFDRYIPISHFLENHLQSKNSKAQTLLIPPICDFDNFQSLGTNNKSTSAYFLFCGSAAYSEVVVFIIESYLKMKNRDAVQLYLVLSGKCEPSLQALIDSNKSNIKVFSNLDYTDLITLYKNALGLLVPLREIIQDEARFPQKICEYVASGKIIISTNVGEVKFYFKDLSNAVLADKYTTDSYSQKLDWVVSNEDKLKVLETNSYDTGKKHFDYKAYVLPLKTSLN